MRRGIFVAWQVATLVIAACLYFFFVLPRWPEFAGQTSPTLGTVLRISSGLLVALAAVPVALDLAKRRPPEFGTPQLALALRRCAIAGQLAAGLLIIGAAVTEIWVSLDDAGQILFGVYGGAAALAVLAAGAFYLAFAAETTPAPPKPLKPRTARAPEETGDDERTVPAADQPAVTDDNAPTRARLRNRREPKASAALSAKD